MSVSTDTAGLRERSHAPADGALQNAMQRVIDEAASGVAVSAAFGSATPASEGALHDAMQRVIDEAASGVAVSAAFGSSVQH